MLKTILLVLDGEEVDHPSVDFAIRWAAEADALLVGLGIIDESQIFPIEAVPIGAGQSKLMRDAVRLHEQRQLIENRLSNLALRCAEKQVAFKPLEHVGQPAEEITVEAQRFDVVIIPRHISDGKDTSDHGLTNALYTILRATPRPVIAVSNSPANGQAVLVAYDGSLQAARALQMLEAIGIAATRPVYVISLDDISVEAARRGNRAIDYLAHHGVCATLHAETRTSHPSERIIEFARQLDAGLIVMGAYGQPRVREFFLGSVTRTLMAKCAIPLFLCH